jgi:alpha-N-arabinofuranosidase
MLLTPTYHVFEMFKVHQDAVLQPAEVMAGRYSYGEESVAQISVSASIDAGGRLHVTLCNTDPHSAASVDCDTGGFAGKRISGRVLAAPSMNSHNSFDRPERVQPVSFVGARLTGGGFAAEIPPMSVAVLELE